MLLEFYGELIRLRREIPALASLTKDNMEVSDYERERIFIIRRWNGPDEALGVFNFGEEWKTRRISLPHGRWKMRLDSADKSWQGPESQVPAEIISHGEKTLTLSPYSFILFVKDDGM